MPQVLELDLHGHFSGGMVCVEIEGCLGKYRTESANGPWWHLLAEACIVLDRESGDIFVADEELVDQFEVVSYGIRDSVHCLLLRKRSGS